VNKLRVPQALDEATMSPSGQRFLLWTLGRV